MGTNGGSAEEDQVTGHGDSSSGTGASRPTLDSAVRRRRADRAFYIRLAGALAQNERALERLKQ